MMPLGSHTVTVCREDGRQVVKHCHWEAESRGVNNILGTGVQKKFLLILPSDVTIAPGDFVVPGDSPAAGRFPGDAEGAWQVTWVKDLTASPIPHIEAGN